MTIQFNDRMTNLATGLGDPLIDKTAGDAHTLITYSPAQMIELYRSSWLARNIVDEPAHDMTRKWRAWQGGPETIAKMETVERVLNVRGVVHNAVQTARLLGGAAILIGDGSPHPERPLNQTEKHGIKYLHVFARTELATEEADKETDLASPDYGKYKFYTVKQVKDHQEREVKIHASRLVLFDGAHVPTRTGWGDSVLQYCWEPIRQAESTMANIMALIGEAKLDVISVPDLAAMLSTASGVKKVQERFIAANAIKSILGVTLIGSGESWERKQVGFDQLPALANQFLQNCASAAKMPVTRLLGQSPAGLGSTGAGETRQYYDMINGRQETGMRTALARFDAHLISHAGADIAPSDYIWNPLYQMSEPDAAAAAKLRAETSAIYAESGLIPMEDLKSAVKAQIKSQGVYPGMGASSSIQGG